MDVKYPKPPVLFHSAVEPFYIKLRIENANTSKDVWFLSLGQGFVKGGPVDKSVAVLKRGSVIEANVTISEDKNYKNAFYLKDVKCTGEDKTVSKLFGQIKGIEQIKETPFLQRAYKNINTDIEIDKLEY